MCTVRLLCQMSGLLSEALTHSKTHQSDSPWKFWLVQSKQADTHHEISHIGQLVLLLINQVTVSEKRVRIHIFCHSSMKKWYRDKESRGLHSVVCVFEILHKDTDKNSWYCRTIFYDGEISQKTTDWPICLHTFSNISICLYIMQQHLAPLP